jgi:hypothetical protein
MTTPDATADPFIRRWAASGAAERANYQLFLSELCVMLDVPPPDPTRPDDADNAYVFERNVHFQEDDGSTTIGRIDLYKRGAFVLEAKQGSDVETADEADAELLQPERAKKSKRRGTAVRGTKAWDGAMVKARGQADRYARALPVSEGWPPFLIVVDVGHSIELYSDFSRSGKTYVPFPDPQSFRILLGDLANKGIRARLQQVWLDPLSLDPSRRTAKVTRELAQRLAELAKLLEKAGHHPEDVARFLMRALFTMFAEDVELIPRGSFKDLLGGLLDEPQNFKPAAEDLWRTMNNGGFSAILRKRLLRFNGGLFAESDALPLTKPMLALLHEAAGADWTDVEPAIFGTLLERALDPIERHKLGAHYTPRAYVERLVLPTVIEPLREDWQAAYAAAVTSAKQGDLAAAQKTVRAFHEQLCKTRVLDPACGSGNFLYVTLEQMKRLEGEVLNALREFGDKQQIVFEVDPHQFLGIEVNPRAAAIADLVLWIGYLQWHFRTRGHTAPAEPIIKNYHNIERRDAVLAWDRKEPVLEGGKPVTRWNGRTMKVDPVTGQEIPDESARTLVERYINPRKAEWPVAEYVVGNPPFLGKLFLFRLLGDGYVNALRTAYANTVPDGTDFVMYWWHNAAVLAANKKIRQFGLITTNSIRQSFNRRVVGTALNARHPLSLTFAVADHPWTDSDEGAAVRIAMTVGKAGRRTGLLGTITAETVEPDGHATLELAFEKCRIHENIRCGVETAAAAPLRSNSLVASMGPALGSRGFVVTLAQRASLVKRDGAVAAKRIRRLFNGRDFIEGPRGVYAIDTFGCSEPDLRKQTPAIYQHLYNTVRPERLQNRDRRLREHWWLFRRSNELCREMLNGLPRYIVTVETAKHRLFFFAESSILAEHGTISFGFDDAFFLGLMSSRLHVIWALAMGGTLEDRPRYNKTVCFDPFPFPVCGDAVKVRIRELAEQFDAHRKRRQALHPKLTLTDMYNVLEKLRSGEELTAKDKTIHEHGLVSVLRQIHDDLDAAVFKAYGWPATLTDEEILERLVALNAERAAEEASGLIRWLRPEFQNPAGNGEKQKTLVLASDDDSAEAPAKKSRGKSGKAAGSKRASIGEAAKREWPKGRDAQAKAVLAALRDSDGSVTPDDLAKRFTRAHRETIDELLQALVTLGQARRSRGGKYAS